MVTDNSIMLNDETDNAAVELSVIVPVYQGAETLRRCVDSIMAQQLSSWELLLIDDGSDDGTPQICDELAAADRHIRVFHKDNGGLSDARNYGIERAEGRWITFADCDDEIEPCTLKNVMNAMKEYCGNITGGVDNSVDNFSDNDRCCAIDFIEYSVSANYGSDTNQHNIDFDNRIYNSSTEYFVSTQAWKHAYAWNKVYNRRLFNTLRYEKGQKYEDMIMLPQLLERSEHIMTLPPEAGRYLYYESPGGITACAGGNELKDLLLGYCRLYGWAEKNIAGNTDRRAMAMLYADALNTQIDVARMTDATPVLPVRHYNATFKECLLGIIGMKALCRLWKIIKGKE